MHLGRNAFTIGSLRAPTSPALRLKTQRALRAVWAFPLAVMALAVVGAVATEGLRGESVDPEYGARITLLRTQLASNPDRPLFLVVGSSRVVAGFAPETLPSLSTLDGRPILPFNLARMGAGPVTNYLTLTRLFRDNIRPVWVLIELMPGILAGEDSAAVARRCAARDLPVAHPYVPVDKLYPEYLRERTVHLAGVVQRAWNPADPATQYGPLGGYLGLRDRFDTAERDRLVAEQAVCYGPLLRAFAVPPDADRAVRDSVRLCHDHGARVGLLMMPEGIDFRRLYGPGCEQRFVEYVVGVGQELEVPVIDARDWLAEDELADSHHALRQGAAKFTSRLIREVLGPTATGW